MCQKETKQLAYRQLHDFAGIVRADHGNLDAA